MTCDKNCCSLDLSSHSGNWLIVVACVIITLLQFFLWAALLTGLHVRAAFGVYRSVQSMQNVPTLYALGMIACGYSSGQTCQKQKKPPCRSVAAQIAHFIQRESFHALDYVVMHCDNSATFAFLNHNIHFFT